MGQKRWGRWLAGVFLLVGFLVSCGGGGGGNGGGQPQPVVVNAPAGEATISGEVDTGGQAAKLLDRSPLFRLDLNTATLSVRTIFGQVVAENIPLTPLNETRARFSFTVPAGLDYILTVSDGNPANDLKRFVPVVQPGPLSLADIDVASTDALSLLEEFLEEELALNPGSLHLGEEPLPAPLEERVISGAQEANTRVIPNGFYLAALLDLIAKQVDASAFLATLPLPSALLSLLEQVNTEVRDRLSNLQGTDEQLLRAVLLQLGPAAFRITGITLTPENVEAAPPFSVAVNQGDIDRVAGVNSGPPQVIVEGGLFLEGEVIRLNEEKTIRTDTPTAAVYFTKPLDTATTDGVRVIVENRKTTTTLAFTPQDTQSFAEVFWRENDSVLFIQVTNRNETFKLRDNTPYEVNVDVPSTVKAKDGTAFRADVIGPILFFVDLP